MSKKVAFQTERKSKESRRKKFTVLFSVCLAAVLVLSCVYILAKNDFNVRAAIGGEVETTAGEDENTADSEQTVKRYLLWGCNSAKTELEFLYAVKAEYPSGKITICSLSPYLTTEYQGGVYSLSTIFEKYGDKILGTVAAERLKIKFDGYIGSTSETFKQMINYFGSVGISVDEKIEYKGEFNLLLMEGDTGMKGDTLYKYLVYLGTLGDKGLEERAQTLSEILSSVLLSKYIDRTDRIFAKMANSLMTDITILNFSSSKDIINYFLENGASEYILTTSISKIK